MLAHGCQGWYLYGIKKTILCDDFLRWVSLNRGPVAHDSSDMALNSN